MTTITPKFFYFQKITEIITQTKNFYNQMKTRPRLKQQLPVNYSSGTFIKINLQQALNSQVNLHPSNLADGKQVCLISILFCQQICSTLQCRMYVYEINRLSQLGDSNITDITFNKRNFRKKIVTTNNTYIAPQRTLVTPRGILFCQLCPFSLINLRINHRNTFSGNKTRVPHTCSPHSMT